MAWVFEKDGGIDVDLVKTEFNNDDHVSKIGAQFKREIHTEQDGGVLESKSHLEDMWEAYCDFEAYSYNEEEIAFPDFLTEWQIKLDRAMECGLIFSETVLCLKLIRNSNLDSGARFNIFTTLNGHIESELLLRTLNCLNNIKDENKENQDLKSEDNDIKKSLVNILKDCDNYYEDYSEQVPDYVDHQDDKESSEKIYECKDCPRVFQRSQEYHRHTLCHKGPEKTYTCTLCRASFDKESSLEEHMLVHQSDNKTSCELCNKEFYSDKALKHHIKNVHKKNLRCDHCPKLFDRQSKLNKHMETHAKRFAANEGLFQCDQCGKEMQGKKRLRIHKRTHFQFRCQPCNKIFKDQELLNRHVNNHKEYPCLQCGQIFYQQALLVKHSQTVSHGGEKKFSCDLCGKTFMKKYNLQTHQLTHTGEKKFKCEFEDCSMAFYKKDVMIRHMRIHTGERPYQCHVCDRTFTQSGDLSKHKRTHGIHSKQQPQTILPT